MRNIVLTFCLIFCVSILTAQDLDNLVPPAPSAAKMAEFTYTPVSLYRGTQNLSIPLHTIDFYGMQIPISLSYYSGGIRANEDAGLVGLGWSLGHTGVISRTIMGRDDLYKKGSFGFPGGGSLADGYIYDQTLVPDVPSDLTSQAYVDFFYSNDALNIKAGQKDTEPDVFSLSLFGVTSKFVLSKMDGNGNVAVIKLSADANKIVYDEPSQVFTLTTSEGFIATFDKKARSTNATGSNGGSDKWAACQAFLAGPEGLYQAGRFRNITSWYLSEIESPTGRKIFFNYDIVASDKSEYVTVSAASFGSKYGLINSGTGFNIQTDATSAIPYEPTSCTRIIHENFYPTSITSTDLELNVVFNKTTREDLRIPEISGKESYLNPSQTDYVYNTMTFKSPQRITGLVISSTSAFSGASPAFSKTISFGQSYFASGGLNDPSYRFKRLRLDNVTVNDQLYSFDYNDTGLPDKSTNGIDYWGYYNGKIDDQELMPPYVNPIHSTEKFFDVSYYYQQENRKANFNYSKAGLLTKVTYPTKGYTEYEYESNEYRIPEVEYSTSGANVQYVASAFQGDDESDTFVYQNTSGTACGFSGNMKITLRFNNYSGSYNGPVLQADLAEAAIELVNVSTNQVVGSWAPWYELNDVAPSYYEVNLPLPTSFSPGTYKIRAKRKTDSGGQTLYYANVVVTLPVDCDQTAAASGVVTTDQVSGGIRVKRIKNYDHGGEHLGSKRYEYTTDEAGTTVSSGVLMTPLRNIYLSSPSQGAAINAFILTTSSQIPHANSAMGGYMGYSEVKEYLEEANTFNSEGYTVHKFKNRPNDITNALVANSFEEINGKPSINTVFDSSDETVLTESSAYLNTPITTVKALRYQIVFGGFQGYDPQNSIQFSVNYYLKANFVAVSSSSIIESRDDGVFSTYSTYTYNDKFFPASEKTYNSNGDEIITEYRRPTDILNPPVNSPIAEMVEANIISPTIETIQKINGLVESSSAVSYKSDAGTYLPDKTFRWNPERGAYVVSADGTNYASTVFDEVLEIVDYDDKGNPIEFKDRSGVHTAVIWGYNKNYPVAQIQNATYAQASAAVNMSVIDAPTTEALLLTELGKLRTNASLSSAMVTTMTYIPMQGMSTQTDPNGLTTTYEYDIYGRLKLVRDPAGNIVNTYQYNYKGQ